MREGLEGNLCRCTGYQNIVKSVLAAAEAGGAAMTAVDDRPEAGPAPEIGQARLRKEDARLITGRTRWTDNIVLPGMLHLAFVRSPFAHATITSVQTEAAKAAPGVVAVLHRQRPRRGAGLRCRAPGRSRRT